MTGGSARTRSRECSCWFCERPFVFLLLLLLEPTEVSIAAFICAGEAICGRSPLPSDQEAITSEVSSRAHRIPNRESAAQELTPVGLAPNQYGGLFGSIGGLLNCPKAWPVVASTGHIAGCTDHGGHPFGPRFGTRTFVPMTTQTNTSNSCSFPSLSGTVECH